MLTTLTDVKIEPISKSVYFKPVIITYTLNEVEHQHSLMESPSGVAIVIYNTTRNVLVLVKQFRPSVYFGNIEIEDRNSTIDVMKYPFQKGTTLELCSGMVDKNKSLVEIAHEEILEECGYDVPIAKLQKIITCTSGILSLGESQTLYYCEVTDDMKVGPTLEPDKIEVVEMSISELRTVLTQKHILCPTLSLFGIHWFLFSKAPLLEGRKRSKL